MEKEQDQDPTIAQHPNVKIRLAKLIGDEYIIVKDNIPEAEKVYLFAYVGYPKESDKEPVKESVKKKDKK